MLNAVKKALRIAQTNTYYDDEIVSLIRAAIDDLGVVGAEFYYEEVSSDGTVTDYTVTDALVGRAIVTYCRVNFGSPDDYDRIKKSYDEQKAQLRCNSKYRIGGC